MDQTSPLRQHQAPCFALVDAVGQAAATRLRHLPGVVGVFWGRRRRGRRWTEDRALCVHVVRKVAVLPDQEIARVAGGVPTDVYEVGFPGLHATLDATDGVRAAGLHADRHSSITALAAVDGDGAWALLSGHGTMPIAAGRLQQSGEFAGGMGPDVTVVDGGGWPFLGKLVRGSVGAVADFSLALFPGMTADTVLPGHLFAGAPIALRAAPVTEGTRVFHHARQRHRTVMGTVEQISIAGDDASHMVAMRISGLGEVRYRNLVVVRSEPHTPFSVGGESGSLVFDADRRAVGTVVGGSDDGVLSYVLHGFEAVRASIGARFGAFFQETS